MQEKFIDIDGLIASKNPKLLKWLPKFLLRYLKKTIHQDEINEILYENRNLYNADFAHEIVNRFQLDLKVSGLENVPDAPNVLFVCNHPLGGMDALALVDVLDGKRKNIKFIVNDLLMNLKNLSGLFAGVNKHGASSKQSMKNINELFGQDNSLFIFPAGLVSRKSKGKVRDLEWKKTFITRARKFNRPVVPVFIDGHLSNWFYNLANVRKALGIKANIEMLYLADELFKQKGRTIPITFGEPIEASTFDKSKSDYDWAQFVKQKVYDLEGK